MLPAILRCAVFFCVALLLIAPSALVQAEETNKVAFLVGVSKYEKAGLESLSYAEDDVTALAKALKDAGFNHVETLLGSGQGGERATRENIRVKLEVNFANNLKRLKKADTVLIALSGHGQQLDVEKNGKQVEDHFYCPVDALKTDAATLLSVGDLIELVGRNSGAENNLFVIDACRNNPAKGAKGLDGSRISLPRNMAALFGSSSGKQSYECDEYKHGLLTYYLLEGLRGGAKDGDGEVTWDSLVNYTKKHVSSDAPKKVGSEQRPNSISNINGNPPVLVPAGTKSAETNTVATATKPSQVGPPTDKGAQNKPSDSSTTGFGSMPVPVALRPIIYEGKKTGELRDDNSLKMKLIWCEAGKFKMGFVGDEKDVTLTKGFWLGQTGITQPQWKAVMKNAPWAGKDNVREGDDYPATVISAKDADDFAKQLTALERKAGLLPPGWQYALPTAAQREYATKAGTTTAFSFGDKDLKDYGWFGGGNFGTGNAKGEDYAHQVAKKLANPWGFYDLHGNVAEWCRDSVSFDSIRPGGVDPFVAKGENRELRGGGWTAEDYACGSANWAGDIYGFATNGLRIALVPASSVK